MIKKVFGMMILCGLTLTSGYRAWAFGSHPQGVPQAANACMVCHGQNGNSTNAMFPRLAGQFPAYLEKELKAFRSKTRTTPDSATMWPMATNLDDATIHELAVYFGDQVVMPNTATADEALVKQGEDFYRYGTPGVISCASCHSSRGQGQGSYPFPSLTGQHKDYVVKQLKAFREKTRPESNVMANVVPNLTDAQAEAIGAYLQSLKP